MTRSRIGEASILVISVIDFPNSRLHFLNSNHFSSTSLTSSTSSSATRYGAFYTQATFSLAQGQAHVVRKAVLKGKRCSIRRVWGYVELVRRSQTPLHLFGETE